MTGTEQEPICVRLLGRTFGAKAALDGVSLEVPAGRVHALLGPNGAGKTTLLRVLTGLVAPTSGEALVGGVDVAGSPLAVRQLIGIVPSGDRTFYLRLSGLENLLFFGRLRGYGRREARERALRRLDDVGLADAARQPVGTYSHGMQKRLSVARALLHDPAVLLVDEATHDLDPEAAHGVRELARQAAAGGAAVLWATQRVDEIRGLADRLTLLDEGRVRFEGTVGELIERTPAARYVLGLANGSLPGPALEAALRERLDRVGEIGYRPGQGDFVLTLADGAVLGDALAAVLAADVAILSCRQETPEVEDAVVRLLREPA
jgi:ABC-type multidrug transport system ATPase subunit